MCRIIMWQKQQATRDVNLYVKNLENEVRDDTLRRYFGKYGHITSCKVMRDADNRSKGFGFVCYHYPKDAARAIKEMDGKILITKPLYVDYAQRKEERRELLAQQFDNQQTPHISSQNGSNSFKNQENKTNLYIKNLDIGTTDDMLYDAFHGFGEIVSLKIQRDELNHSKGFGWVNFSKPADASRARAMMNGKNLGNKKVYVGYHQNKEERNSILSEQHGNTDKEFSGRAQSAGNFYEMTNSMEEIENDSPDIDPPKLNQNFRQYPVGSALDLDLEEGYPRITRRSVPSSPTNNLWSPPYSSEFTKSNPFDTEKRRSVPSSPNVSTKTRSSITEIRKENLQKTEANNFSKCPTQSSRDFINDRSEIQCGFGTQARNSIQEEVFTTSKSEATYPRTLPDNNQKIHLKEFPNTKRIYRPSTMSNDRSIQKMDNLKSPSEMLQSKLMSKIKVQHPNSAKNIAEILVDEMDSEELEFLLNNTEHLNAKVEEVYKELRKPPIPILIPKPRMKYDAAPSIKTPTPKISPNSLPLQPHQLVSEKISSYKYKTKFSIPESQKNPLQSKFWEKTTRRDTPTVNKLSEENVEDDEDNILMSIRSSEEVMFEAAKKQYPNEANLIVKIISEKCKRQEQNILVNSKTLLDREIERAYLKIRRLDTPVPIQNRK